MSAQDTPLLALKQNQKWICLESLAPDTPYELRVRVRVQPQQGQRPAWSPWSETLDFRTPQAGEAARGRGWVWAGPRRGGASVWERLRVGGADKGEGLGVGGAGTGRGWVWAVPRWGGAAVWAVPRRGGAAVWAGPGRGQGWV